MAMSGKRNFLITGAGSGFGRALATEALSSGYSVIGTVRSEGERQESGAMDRARARAIVLDVTDFAAIGPEVAQAERDVGPIDVLVNSGGYGAIDPAERFRDMIEFAVEMEAGPARAPVSMPPPPTLYEPHPRRFLPRFPPLPSLSPPLPLSLHYNT